MEEVHFWKANDGAVFEDEDDCFKHELEIRFNALGGDIFCMSRSNLARDSEVYTEIDELMEADLLYLGTEEAVNFWKDVAEYECLSPNGFGCCQPGLYYYSDTGEWRNLETDIECLLELKMSILVKKG